MYKAQVLVAFNESKGHEAPTWIFYGSLLFDLWMVCLWKMLWKNVVVDTAAAAMGNLLQNRDNWTTEAYCAPALVLNRYGKC
jgi:hypothetical protein